MNANLMCLSTSESKDAYQLLLQTISEFETSGGGGRVTLANKKGGNGEATPLQILNEYKTHFCDLDHTVLFNVLSLLQMKETKTLGLTCRVFRGIVKPYTKMDETNTTVNDLFTSVLIAFNAFIRKQSHSSGNIVFKFDRFRLHVSFGKCSIKRTRTGVKRQMGRCEMVWFIIDENGNRSLTTPMDNYLPVFYIHDDGYLYFLNEQARDNYEQRLAHIMGYFTHPCSIEFSTCTSYSMPTTKHIGLSDSYERENRTINEALRILNAVLQKNATTTIVDAPAPQQNVMQRDDNGPSFADLQRQELELYIGTGECIEIIAKDGTPALIAKLRTLPTKVIYPSSQVGGSQPKTKTSQKVSMNGRLYILYRGSKGGNYIKTSDGYKPIKISKTLS